MANPIALTVQQLRNAMQLPSRPYEDVYPYDGTSYFDFSHREVGSLLVCSGTASGSPFLFRQGIDFQITAGTLDWTLPGVKPDLFTPFTLDYSYSRLGGDTASTCVANGCLIAAMDLGFDFPYGDSTDTGLAYDDLATFAALLVAAREACVALQASEIEIAQKGRRGGVLIDDSKKTADWQAAAKDWTDRYRRYLTMVRPKGMVRAFSVSSQSLDRSIFGNIGDIVFEGGVQQGVPFAGFPDSSPF